MLSNHHTHSLYSDGSSQPEEYILAAIEKGFNLLGFTEHSPLPFENTFSFKKENKEEYTSLIQTLKLKHYCKPANFQTPFCCFGNARPISPPAVDFPALGI